MAKAFESQHQIVGSMQNGFRDDFLGAQQTWASGINGNWSVSVGTGMTVQRNGSSELTIDSGTTANSTTTITSTQTFSVPFRVLFSIKTNQKIANCDVMAELINPSGDIVGYATIFNNGNVQSQSVLNGTITTGNSPNNTQFVNNTTHIYGIDFFFDELFFVIKPSSNAVNSSTNNEHFRQMWTTKIPDPTQQYSVRIRMVNGATAPASSTTMTVDFVSVQDISIVNAEITGARGAGSSLNVNAIPAYITGASSYTQNVAFASSQTITAYPYRTSNTDTTTSLGASGTYTGTARMTNSAATKFVALAASDQAGTFYIDYNPDGSTWYLGIASVALVAGDAKILEIRQLSYGTQYYRVRYVNGSTAQTKLSIFSEYVSQ